jgi:hypothetical protein
VVNLGAQVDTMSEQGDRVSLVHNDYAFNEQDKADRFRNQLT